MPPCPIEIVETAFAVTDWDALERISPPPPPEPPSPPPPPPPPTTRIDTALKFAGTVQLELATKVITQLFPETTAVLTPLTVWLVQAELAKARSSIAPREKMLATRKAGIPNLRRIRNDALGLLVILERLAIELRPNTHLARGKNHLGSKLLPGSTKP
jgi:hypothetical protein